MSDFVSGFWSLYVTVIVLVSVVGCAAFLWMQSAHKPKGKVSTTGHVWDENLEEYNNPLPKWWMWLFYLTVVFALGYLALYPGLGSSKGMLNWSSSGQYSEEKAKMDSLTKPTFDAFLKTDLNALAKDTKAMETGKRLFLTYCMQCHGSNGSGSKNFPNLTLKNKRWGGAPEEILASITDGRAGVMTPYGGQEEVVGGKAGAKEVANYVRSLAGLQNDSAMSAKGKEKFDQVCVACHGPDGKGMAALGAPNLTDKNIWIYGTSEQDVTDSIILGRNNGTPGRDNTMPAWKGFLRDGEVHVLAAYVISITK